MTSRHVEVLTSLPDLGPLVAAAREVGSPLPMDVNEVLVPTRGATRSSFHLIMRDGTRIAVDLHLPPLEAGVLLPTCLRSTRYWRATVGDLPKEHVGALEAARWTKLGFALVLVDARGTGASFGTWQRGWDDAQRDDLYEIVEWVVAQSWSDGAVGGYGTSYDGTTAQLLASTGHPAVRAVVPRFSLFDNFHHIAAPGGVPQDGFVQAWAAMNWTLDGHPERATAPVLLPINGSVRPVDDDIDGALLQAAQREHAGNWELAAAALGASNRDDSRGGDGVDPEQGTPWGRLDALRASRVPTWLWSGWYDGAYAAAQLAQLADPDLDVRVIIGPYAHGAAQPALGDPLAPELRNTPMSTQVEMMASFLREPSSLPRLSYYRLGDGWQEADQWPPPTSALERLHLGSGGTLGEATDGARTYAVDFAASTGTLGTRWATLMGGAAVCYPDRAVADERLLVWDGQAMAEPTGLTGSPVVHLDLVSSATDCALHIYLEAVLPDGFVLYLTEGQLRASHRAPGNGTAPYETFGPWHSHTHADVVPLVPGAAAWLSLTLWPISVLLPAGSSLRVSLAGADAPQFRRIPDEGDVTLEIAGTSWVDVPFERQSRTGQAGARSTDSAPRRPSPA